MSPERDVAPHIRQWKFRNLVVLLSTRKPQFLSRYLLRMRHRYDLKTELSLALLPTITMGVVLFLLEQYSSQHLLFASLASSAFLIYIDPDHPANRIITLVSSQVLCALIGFSMVRVIGPGYTSAMLSMVLSIITMLLLNIMHPPAVSTSLTFAFEKGKTLPLFLIALGILAILVILQKVSIWLIGRYKKAHPKNIKL